MISLATETERTLFFDFLPLSLGEIRGFKTRFHLYTVPGQVFYDASRKLILKGVDGVVFVADSQIERIEANQESVENLRTNLAEQGYSLDKIPYVIQYNKRDLPNVVAVEELRQLLNPTNVPDFEADRAHRRRRVRHAQGRGEARPDRAQARRLTRERNAHVAFAGRERRARGRPAHARRRSKTRRFATSIASTAPLTKLRSHLHGAHSQGAAATPTSRAHVETLLERYRGSGHARRRSASPRISPNASRDAAPRSAWSSKSFERARHLARRGRRRRALIARLRARRQRAPTSAAAGSARTVPKPNAPRTAAAISPLSPARASITIRRRERSATARTTTSRAERLRMTRN